MNNSMSVGQQTVVNGPQQQQQQQQCPLRIITPPTQITRTTSNGLAKSSSNTIAISRPHYHLGAAVGAAGAGSTASRARTANQQQLKQIASSSSKLFDINSNIKAQKSINNDFIALKASNEANDFIADFSKATIFDGNLLMTNGNQASALQSLAGIKITNNSTIPSTNATLKQSTVAHATDLVTVSGSVPVPLPVNGGGAEEAGVINSNGYAKIQRVRNNAIKKNHSIITTENSVEGTTENFADFEHAPIYNAAGKYISIKLLPTFSSNQFEQYSSTLPSNAPYFVHL